MKTDKESIEQKRQHELEDKGAGCSEAENQELQMLLDERYDQPSEARADYDDKDHSAQDDEQENLPEIVGASTESPFARALADAGISRETFEDNEGEDDALCECSDC